MDVSINGIEKTGIAIIGAGIAGLAAAKTLQDAGFTDYLLLEAQDNVGGRIRTIPTDDGWIECGAQFLHGDMSSLAQYCLNNNLLSDIQGTDGQGIFLRDDGTIINENLMREVDDLVRSVLEECEDYKNENFRGTSRERECIGSILRNRFEKYLREKNSCPAETQMKKELFDWHVRFLLVDNSCYSLDNLSAMMWGKFEYTGGPEYLLFKFGYSSLMNLLLDDINRQKLRLCAPVEFIDWHDFAIPEKDSPIVLTTSEGTQILADAVIVTCSLGYLKNNYRKMFRPSLPDRLSVAIENLGFGSVTKIFLDFGESAWWHSPTKGFQLLWPTDAYHQFLPEWSRDLTGFDVLANYPTALMGWVGGRGARIAENMSEEAIARDCTNLLMHYLKRDIPPVKKCVRTKWNENKYVRGGYSHITKSCEINNVTPATLAEPVWTTTTRNDTPKKVPVISFAGEATHDRYYSTTHGAYETGIQQAEMFLQYYTNAT